VPLDILRFVPAGQRYEKDLHLAFAASRMRGEWFAPTAELVALADGEAPIADFLAGKREQIAATLAARAAVLESDRAIRREATRVADAELKRLDEERKRVKRERKEKTDQARLEREEKKRAEVDHQRWTWNTSAPVALRERLLETARVAEAEQRRAVIAQQRTRNALLLGIGGVRNG
jgi:hypothetical protein